MKLGLSFACLGVASATALNSTKRLGIVNGDPTNYEQWKGTVSVKSLGLCSGAMIDPSVVISAAHCCETAAEDIIVDGGVNVLASPEWTRSVVEKATLGNILDRDLCMLKLSEPVPDTIPFYDIAEDAPQIMSLTTLTGYGYNTLGFPQEGLGIARMGTTYVEFILGSMIEVGLTNQNACAGDSGGPMFILENNRMKIAGVTSVTIPGCSASGPAMYGSLVTSEAKSWVQSSFQALTGRPYVAGQGSSPGDCEVCPGFPSV